MVTTARVPTSPTVNWHERTGLPPTCTVQAPHCATPQPYLVPTRLRWSRSTQSSGISSGTSTWCDCPFILSVSISPSSPDRDVDAAACEDYNGSKLADRALADVRCGADALLSRSKHIAAPDVSS